MRLTELLKQVDNPNMKSVFDSKHISVPTGQLCFSIEDVLGENIQARWKDTKSASLEEKYLDICEGLVEAAYRNRIWRIEREEGERLRQEQQRIREGKEAALKAEEAKKDELFRNASAWHKSQEVRSYVEAVKSSMKVSDEWINWALKKADMIDPTLSGDQKEDE